MNAARRDSRGLIPSESKQPLSGRILVADDDEDIQHLVADALEFMGLSVATVGSGIEALSVFIADAFDLVLTDLQMPGMDGFSLARRIKARSPQTPVILMTGSDCDSVSERIQQSRINHVIFKPLRIDELQQTIQSALGIG